MCSSIKESSHFYFDQSVTLFSKVRRVKWTGKKKVTEESVLMIYLGDKLPTIYDAAMNIYQLSPTPGSQKR